MLSFDTAEALADALALPLDPIVIDRIEDSLKCGLADQTHILVIQPGDTEADIIDAVGFSPLAERIHGTRYGDPAFQPDWDWWERHDGWTELLYCVGDSGFAYLLFVQDVEGVIPDLLTLCRMGR